MGTIKNAKNISLSQNTGTTPDVSDAMMQWYQPMEFIFVNKAVKLFQNVEKPETIKFHGVWQIYSPLNMQIQNVGQRGWKEYIVHSETCLPLDLDDIISYQGVKYRVIQKIDQFLYQYFEYHFCEDWVS